MKKILSVLLILVSVITMAGCNTEEEPPVVTEDTTVITVTSDAVNQIELGADAPDFTTWFEIENSILGDIVVDNNLISSTLPITDGKVSEVGTFQVIITYIDVNNVSYSEILTINVEDNTMVEWDFITYMNNNPSFVKYGDSDVVVTNKMEDGYPILEVDVTKSNNTDWEYLIGTDGLSFMSGNTYTYTIIAKTEVVGGREIGVSFENENHSRLNHSVHTLTSEYQTFTGSVVVASDTDGGKLNVFLGDLTQDETGIVIFKEIRIVESTTVIDGLDNPGEAVWTAPDLTNMDSFVENLIDTMTVEEKIGQMLQGERSSVSVDDIKNYNLGSVLNGGGSIPGDDIADWYRMYLLYQHGAEDSSSGIPIIFGTDAVHGNNNLLNATLFPHNIGLGAANDADLMRRIGEVTAIETRLTGISWTFAPAVSIAQDARWGRTYESLSENTDLVSGLVGSYIDGLQAAGLSACAKHFIGDGGTQYGNDQGNVVISDQEIRDLHLPPYQEAIDADVDTIMISYSSIRGMKMHGNEYWIQTILKDEMGFEGFIISDYDAIHQLPGSHYNQVIDSINAGVDMLMEPHDWRQAYDDLLAGYNNGDLTMERIDDAVRRILTVKYKRGLFTDDIFRYQPELLATEDHLAIAREAVRKSLVLLQNDNDSLPLNKSEKIAIIGPGADDIGLLLGGWSLGWQGAVDPDNSSSAGFGQYRKDARVTSIYDGFTEALLGETGTLVTDINDADTVIVVLAESPYAEYHGDDGNLSVINGNNAHPGNAAAIQQAQAAKAQGKNVVGILLSGRPLLIDDILIHFDSFVAAWLPGSEGGNGIADVLLGDFDFTGKTPFVWYMDSSQFGTNSNDPDYDPNDYLFPYGFGLTYTD